MAPVLWHQYKEGSTTALRRLITYNQFDIDGMKYLLSALLMVFPGGFEPPAFHLGGERSILLSYGNAKHNSSVCGEYCQGIVEKKIKRAEAEVVPAPF